MKKSLAQEFKAQSIFRLEENPPRIKKCLDQLSEDEVWKKPNNSSNSIANLILHLCGNITQYIHSSLANTPDNRNRDLEFSITQAYSKAELFEKIDTVIKTAVKIIDDCDEATLLKLKSVQGFEFSGTGIIIHVVEHLSYHTGQIAFWTKYLKNQDLGFYEGMDLNVKNKE